MNPDTTITPKTKCAALYVRVSTTNRSTRNQAVFEQNPEVQELPLRQMAEQRGWSVVRVYSDRMSGSKSDRPGLNALMRDARRGADRNRPLPRRVLRRRDPPESCSGRR
jgi:hypothetical protein